MLSASKIRIHYFLPLILIVPFFMLKQMNLPPFHYAVDSNLTFVLDSLLINGGKMPAHLFHPDVATLWFERIFIFPLAKWLNFISISTIQEYQASLNPFLNFADVAEFLLVLRSSYLYLACSFIYIGMLKLFETILDKNPLWLQLICVLFFAVLGFHYVAPYSFFSYLIRYEQPAVMWGALTFLMMVLAAQTEQKRYIVFMGIFANLAFLSKIVVLPSIILYVFLYFVLTSHYKKENLISPIQERKQSLWYGISLLIMVVFITTFALIAVFKYNILSYNSQYGRLTDIHMVFLSIPFALAGLSLFILSLFFYCFKDAWARSSYYLHRLLIFMNCMVGTLFLQLFQSNGTKIFPMSYLFSFGLGQISMSMDKNPHNDSQIRIISNFQGFFPYLLMALIVVGLIFLYYVFKNKKSALTPMALGFNAIPFMILLNNLLLREGNEIELGFYTIFIATTVVVLLLYQHTKNRLVIILPMLMATGVHMASLSYKIQKSNIRMDAFYVHQAHFFLQKWYDHSYQNSDGPLYFDTLKKAYPSYEDWLQSFLWARNIKNTKQVLRSLYDNPNKLQDSAVAFEGSLLPGGNEALQSISEEIKNGLVLAVQNPATLYSREDYVFYITTKKVLSQEEQENLEATNFQFNDYYVYRVKGSLFYKINKDLDIKYVIINDYVAKQLLREHNIII